MLSTAINLGPAVLAATPRDVEEFVTELRSLPEGWFAVAGLALVAAACWAVVAMYRHEGRVGATSTRRAFLAVLRCAVLVTLALILLEPVRVRILRRWIDSYAVLLVDDSSSIDLTDHYRNDGAKDRVRRVAGDEATDSARRGTLVETVLNRRNREWLSRLADNNRVKFYTFSDEPQHRATIRAARERPVTKPSPEASANTTNNAEKLVGVADVPTRLTAAGPATNVERAVHRAIESLGSSPVAGLILISDGGLNQGAPAEDIARFARDRRIPIHVVGVGNPESPRNVRVTEVLAPPNAFVQDPFSISARVSVEGIEGQSVQVQLRERAAGDEGPGRVIDTREVSTGPGGAVPPLTFSRRQERVGRYVYTVEAPALEGESVADDNAKNVTVNVIDSRTRVLMVAAAPSWDYLFLSRLLERDDTFDVSCWLQSADASAVRDGDTIIDHLPATAEELFAYDVIILMDPDPEEIDEAWCRLLDTAVTEYGAGMLYCAARPRTASLLRDRSLKPLADLLPVSLDPEADIVLNEIGHYQVSASPLEIPPTAFGHPIMQLAEDAASTRLAWQGIGEVYWHYPVLREKPVATVLLRHGNPRMRNSFGGHVLGAVQFVGAGRSGFLAFDSSWRWRRQGVKVFDRFWVQYIRYLAEGKLLGGIKRGMLLTEGEEFSLGQAVTVSARLLDRQYEPLRVDQLPGQYSVDGERREFTLAARREAPGWYEGRFIPDRTGSFRISVSAPQAGGAGPAEIVKEIQVSRPNLEILRPQMDRAALTTLAEQSHGGRYFEIDQADEIPPLIPDLHEEIPIRSRPTSLWDNWKMLSFLVGLLSVEWAVRKWSRLL